MSRGIQSIRSIIEAKHGPFFDLIRNHCKDCADKESACVALNAILDGIEILPQTLLNTIVKALEKKDDTLSDDDFFVKWVSNNGGKKARGKKSIRSIIEEKHGSFFDLIRKHCKDCTDKESACEALNEALDGIDIKPQTLQSTISKALEVGEISDKDFFVAWIAPKRRGKKNQSSEDSAPAANKVTVVVKCVCQNCGDIRKMVYDEENLKLMGVGVKALRCKGCEKWATYKATYLLDGETKQEKVEKWREFNTRGR